MSKTVYVGRPEVPGRAERPYLEIRESIYRNMASDTQLTSEQDAPGIAQAMATVDAGTPLKAMRYTFGYGAEVRHGSYLLDGVQVMTLRDAVTKIEHEQQDGSDSIKFSLIPGDVSGELIFMKEDWATYGFAIVEELEWGPLIASNPNHDTAAKSKHRITVRRIVELLALTTNAQIGLQDHSITTFGKVEQKLLKGIVDMKMSYGIERPSDNSFWATRASAKEAYEWHIRVNDWEQNHEYAEEFLGTLVSEASRGVMSWRRHDDEKEIMVLARCLETMWSNGARSNKRDRIRKGCRHWMNERNQNENETEAAVELIDRFYDQSRNTLAHEAAGYPLGIDIERAHLNAKIRGIIEDYIWWNLTGEWTSSKPAIISKSEQGGSHRMLWPQMMSYWQEQGVAAEEIRRLWA